MKKVVVTIVCFILLTGCVYAKAKTVTQIIYARGDVQIDLDADGKWEDSAKIGIKLPEGAGIKTGKKAFTALGFDKKGKNIIKIAEWTSIAVGTKSRKAIRARLNDGKIAVLARKLRKGSIFEIKTPGAIISIKESVIGVEHYAGITELFVLKGVAFIQGADKKGRPRDVLIEVPKGKKTAIVGHSDPYPPMKMTNTDIVDWEALAEEGTLVKKAAKKR